MRKCSKEFESIVTSGDANYLVYIDVLLSDGSRLNIRNSEIWQNSFTITDACSNSSSFDIGSVIINQIQFTISNIDGRYDFVEFSGASMSVSIGLRLDSGEIETVGIGKYDLDSSSYNGDLITIIGIDRISRFNRAYTESKLKYPATLQSIVYDACRVCGVQYDGKNFPNQFFVVSSKPVDEKITFREVIMYVAQMSCSFARCDSDGKLSFRFYGEHVQDEFGIVTANHDQIVTANGDNLVVLSSAKGNNVFLDGGYFDNDNARVYRSGDAAHGGYFNPWDDSVESKQITDVDGNNITTADGDNISVFLSQGAPLSYIDGGEMKALGYYHHLTSLRAFNVSTNDFVITGISVSYNDGTNNNSYMSGEVGYVLNIEDNLLIGSPSEAQYIADFVAKTCVGMHFRTFDSDSFVNILIEPGDSVIITDRKNHSYESYATNVISTIGSGQSVMCGAESEQVNSLQTFSSGTKAEAQIGTAVKIANENSTEIIYSCMTLISLSIGMYWSTALDGSMPIYYIHDRESMSSSNKIIKLSGSMIQYTEDGGEEWMDIFDDDGSNIASILNPVYSSIKSIEERLSALECTK